MSRWYRLEGHEAVPVVGGPLAGADAFEQRHRTMQETGVDPWRVAREEYPDGSYISTVFLGLDHGWGSLPLLFETMVFGGPCDGDQERCTTWKQAEAQHAEVVARVKAAQSNDTLNQVGVVSAARGAFQGIADAIDDVRPSHDHASENENG